MSRIGAIFDKVIGSLFYLGAFLIFVSFASVSFEVIFRFFVNKSIFWVSDIAEYILVTSVSLGAAWVLKKEGHIAIDFVLTRFNTKNQALINAITSLAGAGLSGLIAWYGVKTILFHIEKGTIMVQKSLEWPIASLVSVIPLCFFLLFIQFLRRSYGFMQEWKTPPQAKEKSTNLGEL